MDRQIDIRELFMSYQQKIIKALKILADKKDFYDMLLSHGVSPKSMGDMREKLIISDNKLIVYRAIITDKIRKRSLGIYWAYDKDAAWPYDGRDEANDKADFYVVVALVPVESVNMQATATATKMSEQEITVTQGKRILLKEIRYFGSWTKVRSRGFDFDQPQDIETINEWAEA